ncbi:MAG: LysR family transcriptional regulator [Pseudomonadota bacterium]
MDTDQLKLLREVRKRGSFAGAARETGLDPSSVSRAVAAAEEKLGFRVFQRSTRRLSPTEAGARYLDSVSPLLDELDAARDAARLGDAQPSGRLRLTASVAFGHECVIPLLPEFQSLYPDIRLELMLTDQNLDLVETSIDLAIRLAPALEGDLVVTRLRRTRYRLCAAPAYVKAAGYPAVPDDVVHHRCITYALPDLGDAWHFRDAQGTEQTVPIVGNPSISSPLALREALRMGMGIGLLADWLCTRDIRSGRLVTVLPKHEVTASQFETAAYLMYPSRAHLPARVRVTIDFLRRTLRTG